MVQHELNVDANRDRHRARPCTHPPTTGAGAAGAGRQSWHMHGKIKSTNILLDMRSWQTTGRPSLVAHYRSRLGTACLRRPCHGRGHRRRATCMRSGWSSILQDLLRGQVPERQRAAEQRHGGGRCSSRACTRMRGSLALVANCKGIKTTNQNNHSLQNHLEGVNCPVFDS
jgi:hypothetical protein